jgi:hypothetical protein
MNISQKLNVTDAIIAQTTKSFHHIIVSNSISSLQMHFQLTVHSFRTTSYHFFAQPQNQVFQRFGDLTSYLLFHTCTNVISCYGNTPFQIQFQFQIQCNKIIPHHLNWIKFLPNERRVPFCKLVEIPINSMEAELVKLRQRFQFARIEPCCTYLPNRPPIM